MDIADRDGIEERVIVTGAAGWLGREIIASLQAYSPGVQILGIGRRISQVNIAGQNVKIIDLDLKAARDWKPTHVCHLAFLTREKVAEYSEETYKEINRQLTSSAIALSSLPTIRGTMVVSSGAAVSSNLDLYGSLKREAESEFLEFGERCGVPVMVARAWSLSGAYCTKPQHFLFYSLIRQAISSLQDIKISSPYLVRRRYVDAGEFLLAAFSAIPEIGTRVMNSGGELVEAEELANLAIKVFQSTSRVLRSLESASENQADNYFSLDDDMNEWMQHKKLKCSSLEEQLRRSAVAVRRHEDVSIRGKSEY